MSVSIAFRFESSHSGGYVPVLGDSAIVRGDLASQDAGSSNYTIYYQVGGGGLNLVFEKALRGAGQLASVNTRLVAMYDAKYGDGAWTRDRDASIAAPPVSPPLTSFLVPVTPGAAPIGSSMQGVMYSVGPILDEAGITDLAGYAQIYTDAMNEVARVRNEGTPIAGLRVTMLSTGLYAGRVDDEDKLLTDAATGIIQGIVAGVNAEPSLADLTILINTDLHPTDAMGKPLRSKEIFGFQSATAALGIPFTKTGFDAPVS